MASSFSGLLCLSLPPRSASPSIASETSVETNEESEMETTSDSFCENDEDMDETHSLHGETELERRVNLFHEVFRHSSVDEIMSSLHEEILPKTKTSQPDEGSTEEQVLALHLIAVSLALLCRISDDKLVTLNLDRLSATLMKPGFWLPRRRKEGSEWLDRYGHSRIPLIPLSAEFAVSKLFFEAAQGKDVTQQFVDYVWLLSEWHDRAARTIDVLMDVVEIVANRGSAIQDHLFIYQAIDILNAVSVYRYIDRIRPICAALADRLHDPPAYVAGARLAVEALMQAEQSNQFFYRGRIPDYYFAEITRNCIHQRFDLETHYAVFAIEGANLILFKTHGPGLKGPSIFSSDRSKTEEAARSVAVVAPYRVSVYSRDEKWYLGIDDYGGRKQDFEINGLFLEALRKWQKLSSEFEQENGKPEGVWSVYRC
ncbi:hypothetical protein H2200_012769 [Cladophialophora chaetospira]|uniref:Uncharacterized protein n=1 Tax=Cladophialophora chaetospira TaxID=386627 RepID=A0AA38WWR9_9EURO|nr:hypothetical protein H2200_012769 [Cladophialophora chaetospira]